MALAIEFDVTLCRQVMDLTGLGATTDHVTVDRAVSPFVRWETVRGWSAQPVSGNAVTFFDYEFPEGTDYKYRVKEFNASGTLTGTTEYAVSATEFNEPWLKIPAVPVLNRPVVIVDRGDITNRSRSGVMDVVGRNYPVQIGDVRAGLAYTLQLLTDTAAEERDMEYTLSTGDVIFLHLPAAVEVLPGGYFSVGDVQRASTLRRSPRRVWSLPLIAVAAPGSEVIGSAYTIASVLAEYETVTTMLADNDTIGDLISRTGTPSEVLVP
ncbi:hypothetical protein [Kribbella sp. NPDC051770]|uniref:hypothetical protein n=1 Tax=Kribbella sp. NPDC051770 TaxID=3155413 RepID=UPI0034468C9C